MKCKLCQEPLEDDEKSLLVHFLANHSEVVEQFMEERK